MFKKFMSYYKPHLGSLFLVLSAVTIFTLIELSTPIFTRYILNDVVPNNDITTLIKVISIMLILAITYMITQYIITYRGHLLGVKMENDMRLEAYDKLQQLSFNYYDKNKTGVIMTRLTTDLHDLAELAHHGIEDILAVTIMLVLGYIYLIQINFLVTTILFVVAFVLLFVLLFTRKSMIKAFRKLKEEHAEINSRLEGSISAIRLSRAFANEEYEKANFKEENIRYIKAYDRAYQSLGSSVSTNSFFTQFLSISVLALGSYLVLNKTGFSTGDFFAYVLYFGLVVQPIKRIVQMLEQFQQGMTGFERFQYLMNEPVMIKNKPQARKWLKPRGAIKFKDVDFTYEDGTKVLDDFNLTIKPKQMVALVGPSGVGKTTISQLIPRFYDVADGELLIDGVDVRDYDIKSLRENIAYVQQDVVLFWGTIKDNIAYGNPEASDIQIREAAKAAGIDEFIDSLPEKYETPVGERGVRLSGGQKQRLSLARIFLKDPTILILDEATSALDTITETYVQQSIEKLSQNRTILVIAHRLSTVQHADSIVVMSEEGIVQQGTHQELLKQEGHYKRLYEASENGILKDE